MKSRLRPSIFLFIGVLMIATSGSFLFSEHFVFNVPVELNNISSDFQKWAIKITVCEHSSGVNNVAEILHKFQVLGGKFRKTLQIKFNALPGKDPYLGKFYYVFLMVKPKGTSEYQSANLVIKDYMRDETAPYKTYITQGVINR